MQPLPITPTPDISWISGRIPINHRNWVEVDAAKIPDDATHHVVDEEVTAVRFGRLMLDVVESDDEEGRPVTQIEIVRFQVLAILPLQ